MSELAIYKRSFTEVFIQVKMATLRQVRRVQPVFCYFRWIFALCCLIVVQCRSQDYCKDDFARCICTQDEVVCRNETRLIVDLVALYPKIKDHVKSIIVTGSTFRELHVNFFGSCNSASDLVLNELKYVDLSNNKIERVHGKTLHCMPNTETLIMRDNQWAIDRKDQQLGYFTSLGKLKVLDLTNTFEDVTDGTIHFYKLARIFNETDMKQLEELSLAQNEFIVLSKTAANSLCRLTNLKSLNLSHNYFMEPSMPNDPNCFTHLETLDLSSNHIDYLSEEFTTEMDDVYNKYNTLASVRLQDNPFNCDCGLLHTWNWLNSTKVPVDKTELRCANGYHSSYIGRRLLDLSPADLLCDQSALPATHSAATTVILMLIFVIIVVTVVGFIIMNRTKLRYCLTNWKKKMPKVQFNSKQGYSSVQEVATI